MLRKKIKYILLIAGIMSCIGIGLLVNDNKTSNKPIQIKEYDKVEVDICDSIREEVNKVGRLEVLQVQTGKKVTLSNDISFSWLKNNLNINYKIKSNFFIDFTKCAVQVNGNSVVIYCNEPIIESRIDYSLTTVEKDKGFLVIGDLELTPAENQKLENDIINQVTNELKDEYETARANAENQLENILNKLSIQRNIKIVYI